MKLLAIFLVSAISVLGADMLSVFGHQWSVFNAADWKIVQQDGAQILRLETPRGPLPGPRRPMQFAIAQTPAFKHVTVEADVRPRRKSLIIVFAYRDAAHFDYAHLSVDTGVKQPVHNGIFHVFGGERVRISSQAGPAAFSQTGHWYHVLLTYDGESGAVHVDVDGRPVPALHAVDLSLDSGKVGLGSFDEVGDFKQVKIVGTPSQ